MRKRIYEFLIVIFCVNFYIRCSGHSSSSKVQDNIVKLTSMDSNYKKVGYDTTILSIEKKAASNVSWDELFGIKEFINLYEHSSFYNNDAIEFLRRGEYTDAQKKISINSMQRSNLDDYVGICKACKSFYDSGKISKDVLCSA